MRSILFWIVLWLILIVAHLMGVETTDRLLAGILYCLMWMATIAPGREP